MKSHGKWFKKIKNLYIALSLLTTITPVVIVLIIVPYNISNILSQLQKENISILMHISEHFQELQQRLKDKLNELASPNNLRHLKTIYATCSLYDNHEDKVKCLFSDNFTKHIIKHAEKTELFKIKDFTVIDWYNGKVLLSTHFPNTIFKSVRHAFKKHPYLNLYNEVEKKPNYVAFRDLMSNNSLKGIAIAQSIIDQNKRPIAVAILLTDTNIFSHIEPIGNLFPYVVGTDHILRSDIKGEGNVIKVSIKKGIVKIDDPTIDDILAGNPSNLDFIKEDDTIILFPHIRSLRLPISEGLVAEQVISYYIVTYIFGTPYIIIAERPLSGLVMAVKMAMVRVGGTALLSILIFSLLAILLWRKLIYNPIKNLLLIVDDLTHSTSKTVFKITYKGVYEFEELIDKFNNFLNTLKSTIDDVIIDIEKLFNNFSNFLPVAEELKESLSYGVEKLKQNHEEIVTQHTSLDDILKNIEEIMSNLERIINASGEQVAATQEFSSSLNETIHTFESIREKIERAGGAIEDLEKASSEGMQLLETTVEKIEEVKSHSTSIEGVIKLINEIAEQTNLLAINASIEASHAGSHGKGFSVVAEEIRRLAEQTQENANSISGLLSTILSIIDETVEMSIRSRGEFENIYNRIEQINISIMEIESGLEEQSKANNQLLEAVVLIRDGTTRIDESTKLISEHMENFKEKLTTTVTSIKNMTQEMDRIILHQTKLSKTLVTFSDGLANISAILNSIKDKINTFKISM